MFLLRLIWAVVQALGGFVVGTQAIGLNHVFGMDRWLVRAP